MKRLGLTAILTIIIILLLAGLGYSAYKKGVLGSGGNGTVIKDSGDNVSDYSAVFLTNGQVYFGKMNLLTSEEVDISDIYYLQVNQQLQQPNDKNSNNNQQPNVVLVKLGNELHGPVDHMRINRSQVIFTESLKNDSRVVKAIMNDKNGANKNQPSPTP